MKDENIIPELKKLVNDTVELHDTRSIKYVITPDERSDLLDAMIALHRIYKRVVTDE